MRVIAGSAGGRTLQSPSGSRVRPTADRVKEALFSSLASRIGSFEGTVAIDFFAGSGSLGIEALSRGAESVTFVDSSPDSLRYVRKNLDQTGLGAQATILKMDALSAARSMAASGSKFDIIFIDPPYAEILLTEQLLEVIKRFSLMTEDGIIVLESSSKAEIRLPAGLDLVSRKFYGDCSLSYIQQSSESA